MAETCFTNFTITGGEKDIKSVKKIFNSILSGKYNTGKFKDVDSSWFGLLEVALGIEKPECDGRWEFYIDEDEEKEKVFTFYTESAWTPDLLPLIALKNKFPTIHYYYLASEEVDEFFITNDIEGKFYPERWYVRFEDGDTFYVDSFEEAKDIVLSISRNEGLKMPTLPLKEENIEEFVEKFNELNEDSLYICAIDVITKDHPFVSLKYGFTTKFYGD